MRKLTKLCLAVFILQLIAACTFFDGDIDEESTIEEIQDVVGSNNVSQSNRASLVLPSNEEVHRSSRFVLGGTGLWAGHQASGTVTHLGLPDGERRWQRNIGCKSTTMVLMTSFLYVACFDSGEIMVLDATNGELFNRKWIGHGLFGLIGVEEYLYVTVGHEDVLVVLESETLNEIARTATGRGPRGLGLHQMSLYVTHFVGGEILVYDAQTLDTIKTIQLDSQSIGPESLTFSRRNDRAYLPHQLQNTKNMDRMFDNTVFPLVGVLDTMALEYIGGEALALDAIDAPVSMPIASVLSLDERYLYVVNSGSNDLSVIDLANGLGAGPIAVGQHPQEIAMSADGVWLYTLNMVSDDITVMEVATQSVVATFPLAADPRTGAVKRGERIFFDSRANSVARDNWMACASCHIDGGHDGQTWIGTDPGPRNTTILRGIDNTEPLLWSAERTNVKAFQETFITLMGGSGLSDSELVDLEAYLHSLEPISSPYRGRNGDLKPQAIIGARLFLASGCAVCHVPPLFTDRQRHDVGTGDSFYSQPSDIGMIPEKLGSQYDTPSLRELWQTAPYLHDGRAKDLYSVLTVFNPDDSHGRTDKLSRWELEALQVFLNSLPLTVSESEEYFRE